MDATPANKAINAIRLLLRMKLRKGSVIGIVGILRKTHLFG